MNITITRGNDPEATRRILGGLPDWFGIPAANEHYVSAAAEKDSYLARVEGSTVGVALIDRHFPDTGEIHLIAVAPEHHGTGVGSALVTAIEHDLRTDGARLLEVKTVGPSHDDAGYAATRAFYAARGFLPLEEIRGLEWDGPLVIMVKPL
ncbi:GNAT family N-acetyltransferase [Ornithinimicrobium faecis]|uniref:GNAT family N-acetyltransferase n=1 Tax=Ornithinimicrobium faecis TaxID=2934158 RepID=A0ABY4YPT8_9MICO|nr:MULTISPECIES: GNAT family N-acetyltransferase [unclassified Ornithinimicrobium]USQ78774.1 GNAT family N-acetyltransferase [Ornithinimicrobium sp. HY1793]